MSPDFVAWFGEWWGLYLPIIVVVAGAVVAGIMAVLNRRGGERAALKNPLPPSWPEMWQRIDAQDARIETLEKELSQVQRARDVLEKTVIRLVARNEEITTHVLTLEAGYPDPPGPPPRPWKTLPDNY